MKYLLYSEDFPSAAGRTARHTGIGRYCADLAHGLATGGRAVAVLAPCERPDDAYATLPLPRWDGRVASRARRVRDALAAGAGHLVIAGDPLAHRVLAAGGLPRGVPCVPVFYGSELRGLAPVLQYDGWSPIARFQRGTWRRYMDRAAQRVCISRYTHAELEAAMGGPTRAVIVPPAVAPMLLSPVAPAPVHDGPLRVLIIGRISERKNQLGTLRMLAALREDGVAVHCTVLGNVDGAVHEPYGAALRAFIEGAGIADAVTFVAEATDEEKVSHLDACDVVVALSRTAGLSVEGFGITAVEAGARARPVLVSTEGGMPETIVEGETGMAVGVDDARAFGEALRALTDPALRARIGAAGRARIEREHTPAVMAERFEAGLA